MKSAAIIQARMGSTRLPGKVLKTVNGKTLLEIQLERVKRSSSLDEIIVATTTRKADDEIVSLCNTLSIPVFRGSEDDVLSRYYHAAKAYSVDVIVRLTSDCPLMDPEVVDKMVNTYQGSQYDYVSNVLKRTYPRGMDVEVFSFTSLEQAYLNAKEKHEREHVTPYIHRHPDCFDLGNVLHSSDENHHRWTVDTPEDFELISKIIHYFNEKIITAGMDDILKLMNQTKPEWTRINSHIEQKVLKG